MKTFLRFISLLLVLCCSHGMNAQSTTYSYPQNLSGYSIDAFAISSNFVAGSTIYNTSGDNNIHLFNTGSTLTYSVGDPNYDDRCVKVLAINSSTFALIGYAQNLSSPVQGQIRVVTFNPNTFAIYNQQLYSIIGTTFNSLYPLDAVYDAANTRIAICGAVAAGDANIVSTQKQAFVMTINPNSLNPTNYAMYGNPGEYSIANRIRLTSSPSLYHLTGSETFNKGAGNVMIIRNMLINGGSMAVMVSKPIILSTGATTSESGADMYETSSEFCILANIQGNAWGIVRVNKTSLNPSTGVFERCQLPGIAYGFQPGNLSAGNDAVVYGMLNPATPNAVPFTSFLNFTIVPAAVTQEVEYQTIIGNAGFWTIGNFFAENNGYPLPSFLHSFMRREKGGIGTPLTLVAPIKGIPGLLNEKYINASPTGTTACVTSSSPFPLVTGIVPSVGPGFSWTMPAKVTSTGSAVSVPYVFVATNFCSGGYYKLGDNTNGPGTNAMVYPNPSHGELYVDLSSYGDAVVSVQLLDLMGKHISTLYEGVAAEKVDCHLPADLAKGLYLLRMEANGGKEQRLEKLSID